MDISGKQNNEQFPSAFAEQMSMSEVNQDAITRHEKTQKMYALKNKAKEFPVPTVDADVRCQLRQLGQPISLFAEEKGFRRERLK